MWPVFLYLSMVQVHTPNADMYFYSCPTTGQVRYYEYDDGGVNWYGVEFVCINKLHITTKLNQANLRQVAK